MASAKQFLSVPLTRKYASMPFLAQKEVISLEYKDKGFMPRRGTSNSSDSPKTRNTENDARETREVTQDKRSSETVTAKPVQSFSFQREIVCRSPSLDRRQTMGATKTPIAEKTAPGSGKPRLHEKEKVKESRQSERISRISTFNERHNGAKIVNANPKTRIQTKEQRNSFYKEKGVRGVKSKKTPLSRKRDIPDKTTPTNKNIEKSPETTSLGREFCFQDYRQKCVQWLKTLPDNKMPQVTNLR